MLHQNYYTFIMLPTDNILKKKRYNRNEEGLEVYLYTFSITMNYKLQNISEKGYETRD